jgi:hypothetical protein
MGLRKTYKFLCDEKGHNKIKGKICLYDSFNAFVNLLGMNLNRFYFDCSKHLIINISRFEDIVIHQNHILSNFTI